MDNGMAEGTITFASIRGYGWNRSPRDLRDHRYTLSLSPSVKRSLPSRVDLRGSFTPRDQGPVGDCTGYAVAQAFDFQCRDQGLPPIRLSSARFIYERECEIERHFGSDSGAFPRDGLEVLLHEGACSEAVWPFDLTHYWDPPSQQAFEDAAHYRIESYHEVPQRVVDMQACLATGHPFVFGFDCYASLETDVVTRTGAVPTPRPGEPRVGGHCVLCVGYDDLDRCFIFLNHWRRQDGRWWGADGFGSIGYEYLENPELAGDLFALGRVVTA